jgi:hypothetical protein
MRAAFASHADFVAAFKNEISKGGLLVRGAAVEGAVAGAACQVSVEVTGEEPVEVSARIAAVVPGVGVAVMFDGVPTVLTELAEGDKGATGPLSERLKAMSQQEKMQLALSGSRDERMALLRDNNKMLHVFVLKNPRIGLDEIQAAAKSPNVSPDALKMIAEHREWSGNPTVCTALVRNPRTPMPLAMKLIDRVPVADLRMIAKGGARDQIVNAARKKIAG